MPTNGRNPQIAICGWSGTGTLEVSQQLRDRLGSDTWEVINPNYENFKSLAKERYPDFNEGEAVATFEQMVGHRYFTDFFCDNELLQKVNKKCFIANARLAAKFLPESFKVLLYCKDTIRYDRVAKWQNTSQLSAAVMTKIEEWKYLLAIKDRYGIDSLEKQCDDFDLILDTGAISLEDIVDGILDRWYKEMCR